MNPDHLSTPFLSAQSELYLAQEKQIKAHSSENEESCSDKKISSFKDSVFAKIHAFLAKHLLRSRPLHNSAEAPIPLLNNYSEILSRTGDLNTWKEDAKTMCSFLSPQCTISKDSEGQITEAPLENYSELEPDTIVIFGNNDLRNVDRVAQVYHNLPNKDSVKIFISGLGGYGTSAGPIFGHSEAETIGMRLQDLGVSSRQITLEPLSTSTLLNVKLLNKLFRAAPAHPKKILLSSTPPSILRQARIFEKQASCPWEALYTLPPEDLSKYYDTPENGKIHLMFTLREFAQLLFTATRTENIDLRDFHEDKMTETLNVFLAYYKKLNPKAKNLKASKFSQDLTAFLKLKSLEQPKDIQFLNLLNEIKDPIREMLNYFRTAWEDVENQNFPRLDPEKLNLREQGDLLNGLLNKSISSIDPYLTGSGQKAIE